MNSTQERFEKAKNLHLMGHYKDAQKIYMELLKKNKDNFVLHNLIGTTFLQLKLYDSAIDHLDISIKVLTANLLTSQASIHAVIVLSFYCLFSNVAWLVWCM